MNHKYQAKRKQLMHDTADRSVRFRMYKSGKNWAVAGISSLILGLSFASFDLNQVKADSETTPPTVSTPSDSTLTTEETHQMQTPTGDDQGVEQGDQTEGQSVEDQTPPGPTDPQVAVPEPATPAPVADPEQPAEETPAPDQNPTDQQGEGADLTPTPSDPAPEVAPAGDGDAPSTPVGDESAAPAVDEGDPDPDTPVLPDDTKISLGATSNEEENIQVANDEQIFADGDEFINVMGSTLKAGPINLDPMNVTNVFLPKVGDPVWRNYYIGASGYPVRLNWYQGGSTSTPREVTPTSTLTDLEAIKADIAQKYAALNPLYYPLLEGVNMDFVATATNTRWVYSDDPKDPEPWLVLTPDSVITIEVPAQRIAAQGGTYFMPAYYIGLNNRNLTLQGGGGAPPVGQYVNILATSATTRAAAPQYSVTQDAEGNSLLQVSVGGAGFVFRKQTAWTQADAAPSANRNFSVQYTYLSWLDMRSIDLTPEIDEATTTPNLLSGTGSVEGDTITLRRDDGSDTGLTATVDFYGRWSISLPDGMTATDGLYVVETNNQGTDIPGVALVTKESPAKRTITYRNAATGEMIGSPVIQEVTVTAKGTITPSITGTNLGNVTATINRDQTAEEATSAIFAAIDSDYFPYLPGYTTFGTVEALQAHADDDLNEVIWYYPDTLIVTPDDPQDEGDRYDNPDDPNAPLYPAGVDESALTKTINQLIRYYQEDNQTSMGALAPNVMVAMHYGRDAHLVLNPDTGNYELVANDVYDDYEIMNVTSTAPAGSVTQTDDTYTVISPVVAGYIASHYSVTADVAATTELLNNDDADDDPVNDRLEDLDVTYFPADIRVEPGNPHDNGSPVNPDSEDPTWPADPNDPRRYQNVTSTDLNRTIREVVHFRTATEDGQPGIELGDPRTQTLDYNRGATLHYSYDANGQVQVTAEYDQTWQPVDPAATTFPGYPAPVFPEYRALNREKPVVTGNPNQELIERTLYYVRAEDISRRVIRRVIYVTGTGDDKRVIGTGPTQDVLVARSTTLYNGTGQVVFGPWSIGTYPVTYAATIAIAADGTRYVAFNRTVPAAPTEYDVDPDTGERTPRDSVFEVVYYPALQVVTPDDPKAGGDLTDPDDPASPTYPAGVDREALNTVITQTVHHIDKATGNPVADDTVQEVLFTRTATVHYDELNANGNPRVSYTDWVSAKDSFNAVAPLTGVTNADGDALIGFYTVAAVTGVEEDSDDLEDTIYYYPTTVTVTPEAPKNPGDSVDPADPQSPSYPAGVAEENLNSIVTRTVHHTDKASGGMVAPDTVQEILYTRTATVHYDVLDADGNPTVSYADWVTTKDSFDAVSPLTGRTNAEGTAVVGFETIAEVTGVAENADDSEETIFYYPALITVEPTDPKNPGDLTDPDDSQSPQYPAGVAEENLNTTITRIVHHYEKGTTTRVAPDTVQTVLYTRTATINYAVIDADGNPEVSYTAWASTKDSFDEVAPLTGRTNSAGLAVVGFDTIAAVTGVAQDADDTEAAIFYYPAIITVQPTDPKTPEDKTDPDDSGSPNYPEGVAEDDLNTTITRTVHHYEAGTTTKVAEDTIQTVLYTRTATINYGELDDDGNPTVDYSAWTSVKNSFDAVAPLTGLTNTENAAVVGFESVEAVNDVAQTAANTEAAIYYYPGLIVVQPTDPKTPEDKTDSDDPSSPNYPEGVDQDDLNTTITRTVHHVDKASGAQIAPDTAQTVFYTRTATINYGELDADGNPTITYTNWASTKNSFDAVDPLTGLVNAENVAVVGFETIAEVTDVAQTASNTEATIYYYPAVITVEPTDPKNPGDLTDPDDSQSPEYPSGVTEDDLNTTITRTVHHYEAGTTIRVAPDTVQTVLYTRTATVNYGELDAEGNPRVTYTDWATTKDSYDAVSPLTGQTNSENVAVVGFETIAEVTGVAQNAEDTEAAIFYYPAVITVEPTDPKTPEDKTNPDDSGSPNYPAGVAEDDLNTTITRTVHHYEAGTTTKVAADTIQTVLYTRTATINYGELDNDGNPTVDYSAWTAVKNSFDAVAPLTGLTNAENAAVVGFDTIAAVIDVAQDAEDTEAAIYYYPGVIVVEPTDPKTPEDKTDPDDPDSPNYPEGVGQDDLNTTITRTVHHVDKASGAQIAEDSIQTVLYTRTATINYGVLDENGNPTITYTDWTSTKSSFDAVSPLTGLTNAEGTAVVGFDTVAEMTEVAQTTANTEATIYYYPAAVTVEPQDPKQPGDQIDPADPTSPTYPAGVAEKDLNTTITRIVHHYEAGTTTRVAPDTVQTVLYTRTATVHYDRLDGEGNPEVTYTDWQTTKDSFDAVAPLAGRTNAEGAAVVGFDTIAAVTDVAQTATDTEAVIYYYPAAIIVAPEAPKSPGDLTDPEDPQSPVYPAGVTESDLNTTITGRLRMSTRQPEQKSRRTPSSKSGTPG